MEDWRRSPPYATRRNALTRRVLQITFSFVTMLQRRHRIETRMSYPWPLSLCLSVVLAFFRPVLHAPGTVGA